MDADAVSAGFGVVVKQYFPDFKIADNPLDSVLPPTFYVAGFTGTPLQSFGGFARMTFTLRVLVSRSDTQSGGKKIRGLCGDGSGSLYAAIEAPHTDGQQQTLGGACLDVHCTSLAGYRGYVHDSVTYLGAEWTYDVIGEKAA